LYTQEYTKATMETEEWLAKYGYPPLARCQLSPDIENILRIILPILMGKEMSGGEIMATHETLMAWMKRHSAPGVWDRLPPLFFHALEQWMGMIDLLLAE